jgi:hypothetical protein
MGRVPLECSPSVAKYGVAHIRPYHREIARRLVLGQKESEIRMYMGLSESRFSIIINSPLFKYEVARLEAYRDEGVGDVMQTLREVSPLALEVIERTMYGAKSERLRYDAACTIMDRAGHGAINRSTVDFSIGSINYATMQDDEIKRLLRERLDRMKGDMEGKRMQMESAAAIDIQYEVIDKNENQQCSDTEHNTPQQIAQEMFNND